MKLQEVNALIGFMIRVFQIGSKLEMTRRDAT